MPSPIIVPTDVSGGGILLRRYRNLLADQLGFITETTVSVAAAHGAARRVVLSDEFRDDEIMSELLPGGASYLYVRSGDQAGSQRRIVQGSDAGYDGSRGMTTLSRPFDAPLVAGTVVDVTSPLPVKRHLGVKGLDECINEALARCPVIVRLTLTGNGTDQHSMSDYPWLTSEDQILGVYDRYATVPAGNAAQPSPYGFRVDGDGVSRTLVTERAYTAADAPELAVVVRGDRLVYDGSQWTYAAEPGLHDENDRGAVPEHWVTTFGMSRALRFLYRLVKADRRMDQAEKADTLNDLGRERRKWALACLQIQKQEFPQPVAKRMAGLISGFSESGLSSASVSGWP